MSLANSSSTSSTDLKADPIYKLREAIMSNKGYSYLDENNSPTDSIINAAYVVLGQDTFKKDIHTSYYSEIEQQGSVSLKTKSLANSEIYKKISVKEILIFNNDSTFKDAAEIADLVLKSVLENKNEAEFIKKHKSRKRLSSAAFTNDFTNSTASSNIYTPHSAPKRHKSSNSDLLTLKLQLILEKKNKENSLLLTNSPLEINKKSNSKFLILLKTFVKMTEIFSNCLGFYPKYREEPPKDSIKSWDISLIEIDRSKRSHDATVIASFWTTLEKYISDKKSWLL
ncbi:hypothetical protein BB560_001041 [Smittium megazygosporum]|uniref:Cell division control protein 73 C-terminal domain-containing protein n=1 Tax=Smittium megazygosporum TaxID=133381 RepID=A0A2T9ZIQ4_9FUNG|nr:hypothetical protein BB560_001041 [Smittium megazygosporum]